MNFSTNRFCPNLDAHWNRCTHGRNSLTQTWKKSICFFQLFEARHTRTQRNVFLRISFSPFFFFLFFFFFLSFFLSFPLSMFSKLHIQTHTHTPTVIHIFFEIGNSNRREKRLDFIRDTAGSRMHPHNETLPNLCTSVCVREILITPSQPESAHKLHK